MPLPTIVPQLQAKVMQIPMIAASPKIAGFLAHPAGPFTIHFWAPLMKWSLTIANLADMKRDPSKVSLPQQIAVTATGIIWSRYSMVITPKNWSLFSVNVVMAGTGLTQLYRKYTYKPPMLPPAITDKIAEDDE